MNMSMGMLTIDILCLPGSCLFHNNQRKPQIAGKLQIRIASQFPPHTRYLLISMTHDQGSYSPKLNGNNKALTACEQQRQQKPGTRDWKPGVVSMSTNSKPNGTLTTLPATNERKSPCRP